MKSLYKLKNYPWEGKIYITKNEAEDSYKRENIFGEDAPVRKAIGFYSYKQPFWEWLKKFKLKIL